jgi:hypothetical protein
VPHPYHRPASDGGAVVAQDQSQLVMEGGMGRVRPLPSWEDPA